MHRKNELGLTLSICLMALMFIGLLSEMPLANATFTTFEQYGPHVDQLLIKLYANEQVEFQALENGEIDMVDWPLSKYWIDRWAGNPEIVMQDYGRFDIRQFDILVNGTEPGGTPLSARGIVTAAGTDWSHMQPNIGTSLAFRKAVAYLVDRTYIISTILGGFGVPVYTMVPPALGAYVNTSVDKHEYNPSAAAAALAAGDDGNPATTSDNIRDTDGDGCFDWPGTPIGSSDRILVDFCVRVDDSPGRKEAGQRLIWELATNIRAYSGGAGFYVQEWDAWGSVGARKWWSAGKGAVIYTGGWSFDRNPDFLYDTYHSSMWWDHGRPPNVARISDPVLDGYLEGIKFSETAATVMQNTLAAQARMADMAWLVPAWSPSAPKTVRAAYTGGTNGVPSGDAEDQYRGKAWQGFANQLGTGLNSWFSALGAHVNDIEGNPMNGGVLRYGLSFPEINSFNPIYSEWEWDWEVLSGVSDSMLAVNPYNLAEDLEWIAKRWDVGVWTTPSGEKATKLVFYLRDGVYWHDGVQLTADDIIFTMKDLVTILDSRGLPPPWFYGNLLDVNSITKLDEFQVEVKMNPYWSDYWGYHGPSYFALHWIGGNIILPEHVWREIVTNGDPETFAPDPQLIGSGPFKVFPHSIDPEANDYYVPGQYVRLDKNPNYFQNSPVRVTSHVSASGGAAKLVLTFSDFASQTIGLSVTATVTGYSDAAKTTVNWGPNVYSFNWPSVGPPSGVGNIPAVVRGLVDLTGAPKDTYLKIQLTMTMKIGEVTVWTKSVTLDPVARGYTVPGDITNDGAINVMDCIHLSFHFGLKAWVWPEDDINFDTAINVLDALLLIENWGAIP